MISPLSAQLTTEYHMKNMHDFHNIIIANHFLARSTMAWEDGIPTLQAMDYCKLII
jgi:hypothetical protein